MKTKFLVLRLVLSVIVSSAPFFSTPLKAEIGEITVNGKIIPDVLFQGFYQHNMTKATRCPPVSDAYVRDRVIRQAVVISAAEQRGLPIPDREQKRINRFRKELEYLGPDGSEREIRKAEILKYGTRYSAYIYNFPVTVTHDEILAEYRRLITAKDPRFTDVVIVRHTPLEFKTEKDAADAKALFENGASLSDVISSFQETFDQGYLRVHLNAFWSPIDEVRDYEGDGKDLGSGAIFDTGDRSFIYFNQVKLRSRLRPFTSYRNNNDYVYKKIDWDLTRVKQRERDDKLWQAADVREDGKPISLSAHYPACG